MCKLIASAASHKARGGATLWCPWGVCGNCVYVPCTSAKLSASDTSCKYMHDLVKGPLKYDLFWLLRTFLIVFIYLLFFMCFCRYSLGCESKRNHRGSRGLCNHQSWFCNMYCRGEVPSSGNSRLFAWKRTKGRCYLSSRSHTWDMRWHIGLSSARPHFSGVVVLWQQATEANCVGSSQTVNLHASICQPVWLCFLIFIFF